MIPLSFSIPIVHTEPAPVAQSPCCRSGLVRHQRMLRGLTDLRLGAVTVGRTFTHRPQRVTCSRRDHRGGKRCVLRCWW